jgi:hypothetical protein
VEAFGLNIGIRVWCGVGLSADLYYRLACGIRYWNSTGSALARFLKSSIIISSQRNSLGPYFWSHYHRCFPPRMKSSQHLFAPPVVARRLAHQCDS